MADEPTPLTRRELREQREREEQQRAERAPESRRHADPARARRRPLALGWMLHGWGIGILWLGTHLLVGAAFLLRFGANPDRWNALVVGEVYTQFAGVSQLGRLPIERVLAEVPAPAVRLMQGLYAVTGEDRGRFFLAIVALAVVADLVILIALWRASAGGPIAGAYWALAVPLLAAFALVLTPGREKMLVRYISAVTGAIVCGLSIYIFAAYQVGGDQVQMTLRWAWVENTAFLGENGITLYLRPGQTNSIEATLQTLTDVNAPNLKLAVPTARLVDAATPPDTIAPEVLRSIGLWLAGEPQYDAAGTLWSLQGPLASRARPDAPAPRDYIALAPEIPCALDGVYSEWEQEYRDIQILTSAEAVPGDR